MKFDNDVLYADLSDLINHQPHPVTKQTFRGWYMKMFYTLGRDEVLKLASLARADAKRDKKRYFSRLLKEAALKQAH